MAKIVSFNTDAPSLKPKAVPVSSGDGFALSARVEYVRPTGPREFKSCRVLAASPRLTFSRDFTDKLAFLTWLWDGLSFDRAQAFEMFDQMMRDGVVKIPSGLDEEVLSIFGFTLQQ